MTTNLKQRLGIGYDCELYLPVSYSSRPALLSSGRSAPRGTREQSRAEVGRQLQISKIASMGN